MESDLLQSTAQQVEDLPASQREQARQLLSELQATLQGRQDCLPVFEALLGHDDCFYVEWMFRSKRLGFGIDIDPTQSSWFLIALPPNKIVADSGYLMDATVSDLVDRTLELL